MISAYQQRLEEKFYKTMIRPTITYGAKCWPSRLQHIQNMSLVEMGILKWMCGKTKKDRIRNAHSFKSSNDI